MDSLVGPYAFSASNVYTAEVQNPLNSRSEHPQPPKAKHTKPSAKKFACPFFQNDPTRFARRQACTGPGFSSISRVKEHLYRAHKQPDHQCVRCYYTFLSRNLLEEHQRAEVPCKVSVNNIGNGINEAQCIRLRRKPGGHKTEIERWEDIYRIVFPEASVVPSCYYELQDATASAWKAYALGLKQMGTALMAGVQRDLEGRFHEIENDLRARFLLVVKDRVETIVQELLSKSELSPTDSSGLTTQANTPLDSTSGPPGGALDPGSTNMDWMNIDFTNSDFTVDSQTLSPAIEDSQFVLSQDSMVLFQESPNSY